jgi:cold shock CspA family protein
MNKYRGFVLSFNPYTKYGFVRLYKKNRGKTDYNDVFIHASEIMDDTKQLFIDELVDFCLDIKEEGGIRQYIAKNVTKVRSGVELVPKTRRRVDF